VAETGGGGAAACAQAMHAGIFLDPSVTFNELPSDHSHSHSPPGGGGACRAQRCAAPQCDGSELGGRAMMISGQPPPPLLQHQGPPRPEAAAAVLASQVRCALSGGREGIRQAAANAAPLSLSSRPSSHHPNLAACPHTDHYCTAGYCVSRRCTRQARVLRGEILSERSSKFGIS
jgi:hypothetical protein